MWGGGEGLARGYGEFLERRQNVRPSEACSSYVGTVKCGYTCNERSTLSLSTPRKNRDKKKEREVTRGNENGLQPGAIRPRQVL